MFDFRKVFAHLDGATFKLGSEFRAAVKAATEPYLKQLPPEVCSEDIAADLQRLGWVRRAGDVIELKIPEIK